MRRLAAAAAVTALALVAGAVAGIVLQQGIDRVGVAIPILCIGALAAWWLLERPVAAVTTLVTVIVLLESDSEGFLSQTDAWYRNVVGPVTTTDLLLGLAVAAVLLDLVRTSRPLRAPGALAAPLLLLAAATFGGAVTGYYGGGDLEPLLNSVRVLVYLVVVPVLVVQVLDSADRVRRATVLVLWLVAAKAAIGLFGYLIGAGRTVDGSRLIYYAPTPNLLVTLFLLCVIVAVLLRVPLTPWVPWVTVGAFLTLVLSYRRSWWIAFVMGAALVVVVASGRRGRLVVIGTGALLVVAVWTAVFAGGSTGESEGAVVSRVRSLDPDRIEATSDDRYRLDEQRNVIEEIRRHPLTGLGLGVPWEARHPLPIEHEGGRNYVHTTLLWYWLKLGPFGLLAYVLLHATAAYVAYGLWRRSRDRLIRAIGLATAATIVGLAIAETTGAFTGVEARLTITIGAVYGWLVAAAGTTGGYVERTDARTASAAAAHVS